MANAWIIQPLGILAAGAGSTAAGFDPAYVANDYAGVVWRSAGGTASVDLLIDLGRDASADTIMLFGCDGATAGMTLQVLASTQAVGSSFAAPSWTGAALPFLAGAQMPVSGRGVALWQAPAGGPPAARYWLLRIGGLANAPATVGRVVIGKRIQLERNFSYGAGFGVRDLGGVDFTRRGVLVRQRGKKLRTVGLSFAHVRKDEVESITKPLIEQVGNTEMIALLTDPVADAQRQNRAYFGPLVGDLGHAWRNAAGFEARVNLVSVF
jgi:hypothetical protein